MKWMLIAAAVIMMMAVIALSIGWTLPVAHVASRSAALPATPERIWSVISDVSAYPAWRSDVKKVERLPDRGGQPAWVEEGGSGRLTFVVERSEPERTLIVRIADRSLPFGGAWVYEIAPREGGCTLTITEQGEIYNPLFRFMARFVFGYEATMAAYLDALKTKMSEKT
jgi:Polyketide cyclase / dehydrase and lipid transport